MVLKTEKVKQNPIGPVTQKIANQWSKNVGVDFIKQISEWSSKVKAISMADAMLGESNE